MPLNEEVERRLVVLEGPATRDRRFDLRAFASRAWLGLILPALVIVVGWLLG